MRYFTPGLLLTAVLTAGCSDNEAPPAEDHRPTDYTIQINDVPASPPYTLIEGQTVRFRIKFFNEEGEDLDAVQESHFGGLSFEPASLATAVRVADLNYQFDVTADTPGTGTLQVSYGHDEAADEHALSSATVIVTGEGGAASSQ